MGNLARPMNFWEFLYGNRGPLTDKYIHGLMKITETHWRKTLEESQEFTPHKLHEAIAISRQNENKHRKAPESVEELLGV
jgi:hypothetical protein